MLLVYRPFVDELCRMPADIADQARRFALKFCREPDRPGFRLKRLNNSELWSARVNRNFRAILTQWSGRWVILHVNQHDLAYQWAEGCRVASHDITGEHQVIRAAEFLDTPPADQPGPLAQVPDARLLELGVPADWLEGVRRAASSEDLLNLADYIPEEVVERLLELALGQEVERPKSGLNPRTFAEVEDLEALERLLKAPLEQWVAFLHQEQKEIVEGDFAGPVQVVGSAGTGKTVVAIHRAHFLAQRGRRVLLTSYVTTLCDNIQRGLNRLCTPRQLQKVTVKPVFEVAEELLGRGYSPCSDQDFDELLARRANDGNLALVRGEWTQVVDRAGLTSAAEYCRVARPGRVPLSTERRRELWKILGGLRDDLEARRLITYPEICRRLSQQLRNGQLKSPFDAVVVDELQDLPPSAITLLGDLAGEGPNRLMLIGDAGQRIYQGRFNLRSLGIDTLGRKRRLRINYRTTEEIRRSADRLLDASVPGFDEESEPRHSVSLLRGPEPSVTGYDSSEEQSRAVADQIARALQEGILAHEVAIFCRTQRSFPILEKALAAAGLAVWNLKKAGSGEGVRLGTMHRAKGLEFKRVFLVDCSADQLPNPKALAHADPADSAQALEGEKQLLYVSLTRARDRVAVSYVGHPSPLVEELK